MFGAKLCVHYWEVVPCSEGPLSEVPLYRYHPSIGIDTAHQAVLISLINWYRYHSLSGIDTLHQVVSRPLINWY